MEIRRKRSGINRLVLVCLFCAAVLVTQLNTVEVVKGIGLPGFFPVGTISSDNLYHKKYDVMIEPKDVLEEETVGEVLLNIASRSSFKSLVLNYICLKTFFLLIPFALWPLRAVLLQEGYISRMFVIQYIHNSDGEKEAAAGRLWQIEN
ncbi:hypothetical protein LAD12857_08820 [Lacrimispora amygdalina]|uniref:Uncharacterized protein n=1 Tax=Lacrimispora amygdalina TaxID=253257 RepID=A0ABQ5M1Y5_9FIRM|nr:hypothetical protein [Clostridium indicum]